MVQANANTYVERTEEEYIVASAFKKAQLKNILLTEDSENEFVPQTDTLPEITAKAQEIKTFNRRRWLRIFRRIPGKAIKIRISPFGFCHLQKWIQIP